MTARVQVVVEAKDATSGVFRAITSQLGDFGNLVDDLTAKKIKWGDVGQHAAQMVINGIKDTIKVTTEYAADVRDLALASGQGAEASSRMLQVLDDYQLTADDAATATRALTKEGLAPTIETIAKLSGQYNSLNSAQEKNEFLQKNLGRASKEWLNLMSQGPAAIMAMNNAVSDSLVLTDENVKAAEEYRLALDEWNDSVMKLKVSIGNELLPVLTNLMNTDLDKKLLEGAEATGIAGAALDELSKRHLPEIYEATVEAREGFVGLNTAMDATIPTEKELAAAAKIMNEENKGFIGTLGTVTNATTSYREGLAAAKAELDAGTISTDEYNAKVGALGATYEETKNKVVLSLIEMKLAADGAFDDSDLNKYLAAGQKLGVFTQGMVTETKRMYNEALNLGDGLDKTGDIIYHTGKRAVDAGADLGIMADGAIALEEAVRPATAAVSGMKSQLNGLPVSGSAWSYDFIINVQGQVPRIATATYTTAGGYNTDIHAGGGGRQQGGEVFAGVPTWVGEAGREKFIPSQNGRILGHAESLHAATVGGMGMSGNNYFYGPVTIAADSGAGGDVMSIR